MADFSRGALVQKIRACYHILLATEFQAYVLRPVRGNSRQVKAIVVGRKHDDNALLNATLAAWHQTQEDYFETIRSFSDN